MFRQEELGGGFNMNKTFKTFLTFLRVNREGALIGGGVGFALFLYIKNQGISLMAAVSQKGLIDAAMSRSSLVAVADVKVAVTCVLLGALIGIIIDALIKPRR
jgi:hypothetical protein